MLRNKTIRASPEAYNISLKSYCSFYSIENSLMNFYLYDSDFSSYSFGRVNKHCTKSSLRNLPSRGSGKIYRAITYVSLNFIPSQCNSSSTSRVDENCLCRSVDFHMWRTYELRISPTKRISSLSVLPSSDQLR